jgi:hypothetical protein
MSDVSPSPPSGTIQTRPLEDGNIEIKLWGNGKEVAVLTCSPQQVNEFVIAILNAAHGAFSLAEKAPDTNLRPIKVPGTVPITQWMIGRTNVQGQNAVALQIGDVVIGLAVNNDQMRGLGRLLIASSWKLDSVSGLTSLLSSLLKDFFEDLSGWGGFFRERLNASSHRLMTSISSIVSGRSLRIFRFISLSPQNTLPTYPVQGRCIYCDAKVYSERPGIRQYPFGGEHIIAESLGGKLELPESSCQRCEEVTGATVENDVTGKTLKALRTHLKIRGKRTRPIPKTLPLTIQVDGNNEIREIPVEDYPVVFMMLICSAPPIFESQQATLPPVTGTTVVVFNHDEKKLRKQYGITSFSTVRWDTVMFCSMLAKIAHSFAVAELGLASFTPMLLDLIVRQDRDSIRLIGGEPNLKPASSALHEIGLGYKRSQGKDYVVATIRLFAAQGGPTYHVVVGESRESPISKFRRVILKRISSTLKHWKARK